MSLRSVWLCSVVISILCNGSVSGAPPNCEIDNVNDIDWSTGLYIPINDTKRGETFRRSVRNIKALTVEMEDGLNNKKPYVAAKLENGELVISLLEEFNDYEEHETLNKIPMKIIFTCEIDKKSLAVTHEIRDTNNHAPEFLPKGTTDYTFTIYTPIGPNIPINQNQDSIVRDIDITNYQIDFTIDPNDYIDISYTKADASKKNHYALIKTKKVIQRIDEPISIMIYATDVDKTGDPRRKTNATIILKSDPATQLPSTPIFDQTFYSAIYADGKLKFDGDITVSYGYDETVKFKLTGENSKYFKVENDKNKLAISLSEPVIPEDIVQSKDFLLFSLIADKENLTSEARAAIHVFFPKAPEETLEFEQFSYASTYFFDNKTFDMPKIILQKGYNTDVIFSLSGDKSPLFAVSHNNEVVTIGVQGDLPESLLDEDSFITITLHGSEAKAIINATSVVTVSLKRTTAPETLLKFEHSSYLSVYFYDNKTFIAPKIKLDEGYSSDVIFELSGDKKSLFTVTHDNEVITIDVQGDLPESLVEEESFITITLHALSAKALNNATSVVTVSLKKSTAPETVLKFEQSSYLSVYFYDNKTFVAPNIILEEGYSNDVIFELSGDKKSLFTIAHKSEVITIGVQGDLPESLLEEESFITITLHALAAKASNNATSVVTVSLKKSPAPETVLKFEQSSYLSVYFYDNKSFVVPNIILEEGYSNDVIFELSGDKKSLFTVAHKNEVITIGVQGDLPESLLEEESFITITLHALAAKASNNATSVVTVSLKKSPAPETVLKFEQSSYLSVYFYDNKTFVAPNIILEEGYSNDVIFELSGDEKSLFIVAHKNEVITIGVQGDLPESLLEKDSFITITVHASAAKALINATSVLTISLKKTTAVEKTLKFDKTVYTAVYDYDTDRLTSPDIMLIGYTDSVSFSLDKEHESLFRVKNNKNGNITLEVEGKLSESLLDEGSYLVLTLEAKAPQYPEATTTITVTLKKQIDVGKTLKFDKAIYTATYDYDEKNITSPHIQLKEYTDAVTFSINGEHKSLFGVVDDKDGNITLEVKGTLDESLLEEVYLVLTLEAKAPQYTGASTAITVTLKKEIENKTGISFEESVYEINYFYLNNTIISPDIVLKEGNSSNFTLTGENSKLFKVNVVNEKVMIGVIEPLPETLLVDKNYLLLTLNAHGLTDQIGTTIITVALISDEDSNPIIEFSSPSYTVNITTLSKGSILKVKATSNPIKTIFYNLNGNDADIKAKIQIDEQTGDISVSSYFEIGEYQFTVFATTLVSKTNASTIVNLGVKNASSIEVNKTMNPLVIIDMDEETPHDPINVGNEILESGCTYKIKDTWPKNQQWLSINSTSGYLQTDMKVDREDPSIAFMYLSQIQIEVVVECENANSLTQYTCPSNKINYFESMEPYNRSWIFTPNIPYQPSIGQVTIIINDINDNEPIFENDYLLTGYPSKDLAFLLRPPSLVTVHATDKDINENAQVRYSTKSERFVAHPITGVIYPKENALDGIDKYYTFNVTASDGKWDNDIQIMVKLLDPEHIAVLTVKNALVEEAPVIVEKISSITEFSAQMLFSAVLPTEKSVGDVTPLRMKRFADYFDNDIDSTLVIFVYMFDKKDELLIAKDYSSLIESNNNLPWTVGATDLSQTSFATGNQNKTTINDTTGLIVGVSILAVILFLLLVGFGVWYLLIFQKHYKRFKNSTDSSRILNSAEFDEKKETNINAESEIQVPSVRPQEFTGQNFSAYNSDAYESNENKSKILRESDVEEDEFGEKKSADRKKSVVTFNERVQQINIDQYENERL